MRKLRVRRHEVIQPHDQSYRLIPLTQGQNAIVDTADYEWLMQWNWCAAWNQHIKNFYVTRRGENPTTIAMSRQIMSCGPTEEVDHWNHNTLDNRRANLRVCTGSQNCCNRRLSSSNTSGFIGVNWDKRAQKWRAQIRIMGRTKHIGHYTTPEEASVAYNQTAKIMRGEFAKV